MHIISTTSDKISCYKNHLLVKPIVPEDEEKSASGIVVGFRKDKALVDRRSISGEVVDVCFEDATPCLFGKGDVVFFPSTDGIDVKLDDGDFMFLKLSSVIAYIPKYKM